MNERIQELAKQARKHARDYVAECMHYGYHLEHNTLEVEFEEKFAELIVQDCANWIREHYDSSNAEPLAFGLEMQYQLHGDYA